MVSDNTVILVGMVLLFTALVMYLPLITWIIIGGDAQREEETEEIYTYKDKKYILLGKRTLNKNKETRMWERVVNYCLEDESLYFTRSEEEFYRKFKKEEIC